MVKVEPALFDKNVPGVNKPGFIYCSNSMTNLNICRNVQLFCKLTQLDTIEKFFLEI